MRDDYQPHRFPYLWRIADGYPAKDIKPNNCKVFGTFVCGGGSTMGYKLAGYEHLGGVEIDPVIAEIYKKNHHPKYFYTMDIREFNELTGLPAELYNLDLLDGSPPCSTFSMAGQREKAWGKEKQFAEGQKYQRLDDLVFVYCDTIKKLMPKVCLLENVAGLCRGNGKVYAKNIVKKLEQTGYKVQVFLLNGATMGVPQRRERVFFVGLRNDFKLPKLELNFNEKPILFGEIKDGMGKDIVGDETLKTWLHRLPADNNFADTNIRYKKKNTGFNQMYAKDEKVLPTLRASSYTFLYSVPKLISRTEMLKGSSFPVDYDAEDTKIMFLTGMSVPPIMTAQIAWQIYVQWLSKIKGD